jgi:hypothetical protein
MKVALNIAILTTAFQNCGVVVAKFDFKQLYDVGVWLVNRFILKASRMTQCSVPEARSCFQTDHPPADLPSRVYLYTSNNQTRTNKTYQPQSWHMLIPSSNSTTRALLYSFNSKRSKRRVGLQPNQLPFSPVDQYSFNHLFCPRFRA